jgi:hypothetical protein
MITNTSPNVKSLGEITKSKILKLGSLVMTPKGIARLIKIDNKQCNVKFLHNDAEDTFPEETISSEFSILIKKPQDSWSLWYNIKVPANGTVESLKKVLEEIKLVDSSTSNYSLIYDGKEMKDDFFFDQVNLMPMSKILLTEMKMTEYSFSRHTYTYTYWYIYAMDGITFNVNKRMKLLGVGIYGSHENKVQTGTVKIFEGDVSCVGSILYEEPHEIPAAPTQVDAMTTVRFRRPINIKPNVDYTIQYNQTGTGYVYYGSGGKNNYQLEKGLEINFKYTPGSSHGTSVESGNFGIFYYGI